MVFVCYHGINLMSVFPTNPLIFAPESWKCTLRGPDFKIFPENRRFRACKFRLCREFFPSPAPSPLAEPRGLKVFKRFLKCTSCLHMVVWLLVWHTCICILSCALFSELSVASVDAGLTITVARNVAKTVQLYSAKCEQLVRPHVLINIGTSQGGYGGRGEVNGLVTIC